MKYLLVIALLASSVMAFAGEKFICVQSNGDEYSPKKVIMTQIGETKVEEGYSYKFTLEVFAKNSSKALMTTVVNVKTEDVMYKFKNSANKVEGILYMDEPNDSWLQIGKEDIRLNCI